MHSVYFKILLLRWHLSCIHCCTPEIKFPVTHYVIFNGIAAVYSLMFCSNPTMVQKVTDIPYSWSAPRGTSCKQTNQEILQPTEHPHSMRLHMLGAFAEKTALHCAEIMGGALWLLFFSVMIVVLIDVTWQLEVCFICYKKTNDFTSIITSFKKCLEKKSDYLCNNSLILQHPWIWKSKSVNSCIRYAELEKSVPCQNSWYVCLWLLAMG